MCEVNEKIQEGDMVTIKPKYIYEEDVIEYKIVPGYYYPVVSANCNVVDIQTDHGGGILQKKINEVKLDRERGKTMNRFSFEDWLELSSPDQSGALVDLEYRILNDKEVEEVWDQLEDVPFESKYEGMFIDIPFFIWEKDTPRSIIWGWFDKNHSKGVGWLVNEYRNGDIDMNNKNNAHPSNTDKLTIEFDGEYFDVIHNGKYVEGYCRINDLLHVVEEIEKRNLINREIRETIQEELNNIINTPVIDSFNNEILDNIVEEYMDNMYEPNERIQQEDIRLCITEFVIEAIREKLEGGN